MPICEDDEIRVLDDADREVPDGTPGELCVRGPYTICGYYNAPEKNREAFTRDGFYRMGDIVRKRGRQLYTEGRRKDIINRGGEKISCDEVENYIFGHPKVKSVTLVAMPDETFGEKACAFVIPKPGETLAFEELIAFLKQKRIASFKLPERLEIVERVSDQPGRQDPQARSCASASQPSSHRRERTCSERPGEAKLPHLFKPGRIGRYPTKNLIKYGACCVSNYNTRDGSITPRELARTRVIASTGCGIITNQGAYPDPQGEGKAYFRQLAIYDDKFLPQFETIAGYIHDAGAIAIQQILHAGRYGGIDLGYCVQPSVVPQTLPHFRPPREMTKERHPALHRASTPRRRSAPSRPASTASRSRASWATCSPTSIRRSPTSAPTNTAARSRTAAASCAS